MVVKRIKLPEYKNPPVVEVVAGIQFENIKAIKVPHLTAFWDKIGRKNFPEIQDLDILPKLNQEPGFFLLQDIELPRHWFISKDKNSLIQIQRDRFLYNWKKQSDNSTPYPRYGNFIKCFNEFYNKFEISLKDSKLPTPDIEMLELTYINSIPLADFGDLSKVARLLSGMAWNDKISLPSPRGLNWVWWFEIDELKAKMKVIIVSAQQVEDGTPIIRMELSVRGPAPSKNIKDCQKWFDGSHERIVKSFDELTAEYMHKKWGKK